LTNTDDPLIDAFLSPVNALHRQYEALRAFYVDKIPSKDVASRFNYTPGSFRLLCHQFRQNPEVPFFLENRHALRAAAAAAKKPPALHEQVIALRKQNCSIYDIQRALEQKHQSLSAPAIWKILKTHGFAKLPRRADEERPVNARVEAAPVADARAFSLEPRHFRTEFGGLFLFIPLLVAMRFEAVMARVPLPGTLQIPAVHAIRALLALKLFGRARHQHVMPSVFDEGLALFAGLNAIPKRSFLTEYSCRIEPRCYSILMQHWFDALGTVGIERGESFHLDFHTIPFHGEDALLEKHYVSKRSRRQKGILAFLAQDAGQQMFCYANADLRKDQQNDEILRFVEFWKMRTGALPKELIFDSKLTTYANLSTLNAQKINFITLRRRTEKIIEGLWEHKSAWRKIELSNVARQFRFPKILDQRITLDDYQGPIRQIAITDFGHEKPTLLLTNQMRRSASSLIEFYARRMLIENSIADSVEFFHIDALSSAVALKINCDLQLTLMASSLYRLLGAKVGKEYTTADSSHLFRDFIEANAMVTITDNTVEVAFGKRAHSPLLLAAGFQNTELAVPWWGGRKLKISFG
jgi:Transposase DDE domain